MNKVNSRLISFFKLKIASRNLVIGSFTMTFINVQLLYMNKRCQYILKPMLLLLMT